ncbi:PKD domain-containing protein [Halorussus sp. AFM4]|uniref:PKD domain-containing protein n=1 Tax=Halorussus sp. AFM4 TaxID=3421651 RepID=UPI003EBC8DB4
MTLDRTAILSLTLTMLLVASALPADVAGPVGTASADHDDGPVYTVRQPGTDVCYEIRPYSHDHPKMVPEVVKRGTNTIGDVTGPYRDPDWDGFETIESIMDYRYQDDGRGQTEYYAPYLNTQYMYEIWNYGTYGLYNWSDNGESHMFFYENANGEVSLVVRHDRLNSEAYPTASHRKYNGIYGNVSGDGFHVDSPGGGQATWQFRNLPEGEWAYIDDMYPRQNMDDVYTDADGTRYGHREAEYESRPLREFSGGEFNVNWYWGPGGNDGGAYRGFQNLSEGESVTIEPESFRNVDAWEVRNNTGHGDSDGTVERLRMDRSVVIERGANCIDGASLESSTNTTEVGLNVTFTAESGADRYQWDFDGDGRVDRNTTDATTSHAYETDGNMEVTVTLVAGGHTRQASTTVEVLTGEPPTADFSVDDDAGDADHVVAGETITLNGSASSDNSGAIGGYEWTVDGTARTGERVRYAFDAPGTYDVTLRATDGTGRTDTVNRTVTVVAQDDPNAAAAASPTEVEAGAPIPLDGSGSGDGNGSVETYEWSTPSGAGTVTEDDGGTATPGANVTFESPGEYRVNLTVTDNNGNTATDSVAVNVTAGSDPTIDGVTVPSEVSVSGSLEVSATASDSSRPLDYVWRFRQGGNTETRSGRTASYSFDGVGNASVKLTVRDAAGRTNETAWRGVTVTARPDAALSAPGEATAGESVTLDASESSDEGGEIAEYRWDFDGDGRVDRNGSDPTVSHTYESSGTYEPTVTAVDDDGQTASASASIAVGERDTPQSGDGDSSGNRKALSDSGGGGGASLGPPPVVTETEATGPNSALVDVRNARGDETVEADLPESDAADRTGVGFERLAVDLRGDDTHVAFETAASARPPDGVARLDAPDETLAYLDLGARYRDAAVANATVEFAVNRSALGALSSGDDVAVYRYDDGWRRVNATVVAATDESYRIEATAHGLGTLAVGANRPLAVADAALAGRTVATGDPVEVTATVENRGTAARSATLNLTLDGTAVASETVEVPAGESTEVTLSGPAPAAGTYRVAVGGTAVGNLTVRETIPADTSVTDVSLNRSTIEAGQRVEITATVENTGGEPGERAVTLRLFGDAVATKNVTVPAGGTAEVTFVREVNAAGNYTVEVGGRTASLGVTSADGDDGLGPRAPDVPGFGVGAALVALVAATLLARVRG